MITFLQFLGILFLLMIGLWTATLVVIMAYLIPFLIICNGVYRIDGIRLIQDHFRDPWRNN